MSMSAKQERALLNADEIALLSKTHHPDIYDQDRSELIALQVRLRDLRSKARTVTRHKQREEKGRSEARGKAFPGSSDQPQRRKQIFAAALKRVNKEISRLQKIDANAQHVEAAHKALAQARSAKFEPAIPSGKTAGTGMKSVESRRRRSTLPRSKVGSVLKQNKVAQAVRDARS